ncbi:uncharacterized protein ARMOST_04664 [Armillaria ostoyae]|uniref:Uncharacterized protein n=1 Tax=Armillaria ostoyae TaxID=47428 RepID=A0A284QY03_ARMOS|nr:uncharacterized protein ARMOST_04664 [Armillaria ostoyae]
MLFKGVHQDQEHHHGWQRGDDNSNEGEDNEDDPEEGTSESLQMEQYANLELFLQEPPSCSFLCQPSFVIHTRHFGMLIRIPKDDYYSYLSHPAQALGLMEHAEPRNLSTKTHTTGLYLLVLM